jgi:hypothetical protein
VGRGAGRASFREQLIRGVPPKHPRVSASAGDLLTELQTSWRRIRGDDAGPLFCRVEAARQTKKVPRGARLVWWMNQSKVSTPVFVWPSSSLSERIIKRWLVRFVTPIVGAERARLRVASGFRGGGEMELVELNAPLPVRATLGWWVARRVSAEGALVTYEGASVEAMLAWTARLGTLPIQVLAPGVFRFVPGTARSARLRRMCRQHISEATAATRPTAPAASATTTCAT